jgi:hypothetical protein
VKQVPLPGAERTAMVPPWASMMARAIARPNPLFPVAREREASPR